jgi:methyl-accepting chemotaxis protein
MLIVVLIVVLSFGVSSLVNYYVISTDYEIQIKNTHQSFASTLATNVQQLVQNAYNITEDIALNSDVISFDPEKQKKVMVNVAQRFPYFDLVYVQDLIGDQTARSSGNLGNRANRWWFKKFMAEKKPFVSQSYYTVSGSGDMTVTSIYFGIYDGDTLRGIQGTDLKLNAIQEMIDKFSVGQDSYAYVLDGDGVVIAHPDKNQVTEVTNYKTLKKTAVVKDAQGNVTKDAKGNQLTEEKDIKIPDGLRDITEKVLQGQSGVGEFKDLDGNAIVSAYQSISLPGTSAPWAVITIQKKDSAMAMVRNVTIKNSILGMLIICFSILLMYWFSSRLTRPIAKMIKAMDAVAAGDFTTRIHDVFTNNEIGVMAKNLDQMILTLRNLVNQIVQCTEQVAAASEELSATAAENATAVNHVASAVSGVNDATLSQADAVSTTTNALERMSGSIQQVVAKTCMMNEITDESATLTLDGEKAISDTVNQMATISKAVNNSAEMIAQLGEQSKEISRFVSSISAIAGQTNLLALNAAIEAARAGEQGRGFAVVAEEVRKLAEQSQEAAKQIVTLVAHILEGTEKTITAMNQGTHEVGIGSEVISTAGRSFQAITSLITQLLAQEKEVSAAIKQITADNQQIVQTAHTFEQVSNETTSLVQDALAVTEEQTASMEEIANASCGLAKLSQHLENIVSKFKV